MTTAEIIQSMKDNLANAYTKLANKRAVIPSEKNIANLAACVDSIVPKLQAKTVTPTTAQQTISADAGNDGLSGVTVNAVTSDIDANIVAENIKKDVSVLGVTGTYEADNLNLNALIDRSITTLTIPRTVTSIGIYAFANCAVLTTIIIPNTITSVGLFAFNNCFKLEYVTLENGFNADGLRLSAAFGAKLSADTIVAMLNALADRTGQPAYTLTLGSTNLEKLTPEQIAIATSKNWTLA